MSPQEGVPAHGTQQGPSRRSQDALARYDRRRFLQGVGQFGAVAGLGGFLAACGSDDNGGGGGGSKDLSVLTWEGYLDNSWVKEYSKQSGVNVRVTNSGSAADMFAAVRSNPAKFDIIHNARDWFKPFVEADLLAEFDETKVKNIANIQQGFDWKAGTSVNGKLYGTLYNWGDQPLGWNEKAIKKYDITRYSDAQGRLNDWNVFWDPQFKGKVAIFDDPSSVQPMVALALGFKDPYNLNEQQLDQLAKKLNGLRPQVKRLTSGGASDQITAFVSGEAEIGYINITQVVVESNAQGIPLKVNHAAKQGTPAWSDNAALTKAGAKKGQVAYDFINATMTVPWQARFSAKTGNSGILSESEANSPEAKKAGLDQEKLDLTLIPASTAGQKFFDDLVFYETVEDIQRRIDIWNEFKLGIGS